MKEKLATVAIALVLFLEGCSSIETEESEYIGVDPAGNPVEIYATVLKIPSRPSQKIKGLCLISTGEPSNLFDTACNSIEVVLKDFKGTIKARIDTDERGVFNFTVNDKKKYLIDVVSSKFRLSSKRVEVSAGAEVMLRLVPVSRKQK